MPPPEITLKGHNAGSAFRQYVQSDGVLGAEAGVEPVLQDQTHDDPRKQDDD
jgi:hypothetical protein